MNYRNRQRSKQLGVINSNENIIVRYNIRAQVKPSMLGSGLNPSPDLRWSLSATQATTRLTRVDTLSVSISSTKPVTTIFTGLESMAISARVHLPKLLQSITTILGATRCTLLTVLRVYKCYSRLVHCAIVYLDRTEG
ncbi:hypothetical protein V1505DRAFT_376328 [Lipomyces doorenjongii]